MREERRMRVFKNSVLRRIFGSNRDEVAGEWRKLHNEEINDLYPSPNIILVMKSRRMWWAGLVALMGERRGGYTVLVGKSKAKRPLGRSWRTLGDNIKWIFRKWDEVEVTCKSGNEPSGFIKCGNFLTS